MAESRDYYLATLGVVQYVPRDFCLPETDAVAERVESEVPAVVARSERPADLDILKQNVSSSFEPRSPQEHALQKQASQPPEQRIPSADEASEPEVRFRITCWQPVADLLVVSSLEYGQNPRQPQQELLSGVLRAIGRLPQPLHEPELLDWPTKPGADASASGARTLFSTFLHARLQNRSVRWVLVMGDVAAQYLLSGGQLPEGKAGAEGRIQLTDNTAAIVTPGLEQMLADREHKRATWEAVRFLAEPSA